MAGMQRAATAMGRLKEGLDLYGYGKHLAGMWNLTRSVLPGYA